MADAKSNLDLALATIALSGTIVNSAAVTFIEAHLFIRASFVNDLRAVSKSIIKSTRAIDRLVATLADALTLVSQVLPVDTLAATGSGANIRDRRSLASLARREAHLDTEGVFRARLALVQEGVAFLI